MTKTENNIDFVLEDINDISDKSDLYTRLEDIRSEPAQLMKLAKSYQITSLIEEIDSPLAYPRERLIQGREYALAANPTPTVQNTIHPLLP